MTRKERKIANALRRVLDAVEEYACDRMLDNEEESRPSARRVDREIARARKALREAEGLLTMQPAPVAAVDRTSDG